MVEVMIVVGNGDDVVISTCRNEEGYNEIKLW